MRTFNHVRRSLLLVLLLMLLAFVISAALSIAAVILITETTGPTVVEHVEPHKSNAVAFWNGRVQSLCAHCHESRKKFTEHRGFYNPIGAADRTDPAAGSGVLRMAWWCP